MWFRLFATALVPLLAITYFNLKIVDYYRANNFVSGQVRFRRRNSPQPPVDPDNPKPSSPPDRSKNKEDTVSLKFSTNISEDQKAKKIRQERTLFIMVCCITMTFFICHLPRYGYFHIPDDVIDNAAKSMMFLLLCRICINIYEFVRQDTVIRCTHELKTRFQLPNWARYLNQVITKKRISLRSGVYNPDL